MLVLGRFPSKHIGAMGGSYPLQHIYYIIYCTNVKLTLITQYPNQWITGTLYLTAVALYKFSNLKQHFYKMWCLNLFKILRRLNRSHSWRVCLYG